MCARFAHVWPLLHFCTKWHDTRGWWVGAGACVYRCHKINRIINSDSFDIFSAIFSSDTFYLGFLFLFSAAARVCSVFIMWSTMLILPPDFYLSASALHYQIRGPWLCQIYTRSSLRTVHKQKRTNAYNWTRRWHEWHRAARGCDFVRWFPTDSFISNLENRFAGDFNRSRGGNDRTGEMFEM